MSSFFFFFFFFFQLIFNFYSRKNSLHQILRVRKKGNFFNLGDVLFRRGVFAKCANKQVLRASFCPPTRSIAVLSDQGDVRLVTIFESLYKKNVPENIAKVDKSLTESILVYQVYVDHLQPL